MLLTGILADSRLDSLIIDIT